MDTFSSKKQIGGAGLVAVSDSCDPIDCRPPGSFVHGIFQARILEWVAISFSMFNFCSGKQSGGGGGVVYIYIYKTESLWCTPETIL